MIICKANGTAIRFNARKLDDLPFGIQRKLEKKLLSNLPKDYQRSFIKALGHGSEAMFDLQVPEKIGRPFDTHLRKAYPDEPYIIWDLVGPGDLKNFVPPPESTRSKKLTTVEYLSKHGDTYLVGDFNARDPKGDIDFSITTLQRDVIWINKNLCLRGQPYYWKDQYLAEMDPKNVHAIISGQPMPGFAPLMPRPGQEYPKLEDFVTYKPRESEPLHSITGLAGPRVGRPGLETRDVEQTSSVAKHSHASIRATGQSEKIVSNLRGDDDVFEEPKQPEAAKSQEKTLLKLKRRRNSGEMEGGGSDEEGWSDLQPRSLVYPSLLNHVGLCGAASNIIVRDGMAVQIDPVFVKRHAKQGDDFTPELYAFVDAVDPVKRILSTKIFWSPAFGPEGILKTNAGELVQTDIKEEIPFDAVTHAFPVWPAALWNQSCGGPGQFGQIVVADLQFNLGGQVSGIETLLEWIRGSLKNPPILQRVQPLPPKLLFVILCSGELLIAGGVPVPASYLDELRSGLTSFAKGKATRAKTSVADHTFPVSFDGRKLMRLLYEHVELSKLSIKLSGGLLQVSVSELDAVQPLFNRKVNEFSFLDEGLGYVTIDPPMIFKWQMYDEADSDGSRKTFRHADGRASVTIGSYAETDRMGRVIKTTRTNPDSKKQLAKAPMDCAMLP